MIKTILIKIKDIVEAFGKARAAAYLSRMGRYRDAKKTIQS